MDERQTQIREGAGLEESRLNREFIDWLSRWSTPILLVVLVMAAGYIFYQRTQQGRIDRINQAFMELELAAGTASPNPRALEDIARTYRNVRGVPHIANLAAADEYLRAARLNVAPGSQVGPDGTVDSSDVLSDDQRLRYLTEARRLYAQVLEATGNEPHKAIHAISAAYGLAAVSETRGEFDEARGHYQRLITIGERTGFESHAKVARLRLERLDALAERPHLYAAAELPPLPGAPQPGESAPGFDQPRFDLEGTFQPPQFLDLEPEQELPGTLEVPPSGEQPAPQQAPTEQPADPG